jgi:hypothetical protein
MFLQAPMLGWRGAHVPERKGPRAQLPICAAVSGRAFRPASVIAAQHRPYGAAKPAMFWLWAVREARGLGRATLLELGALFAYRLFPSLASSRLRETCAPA